MHIVNHSKSLRSKTLGESIMKKKFLMQRIRTMVIHSSMVLVLTAGVCAVCQVARTLDFIHTALVQDPMCSDVGGKH